MSGRQGTNQGEALVVLSDSAEALREVLRQWSKRWLLAREVSRDKFSSADRVEEESSGFVRLIGPMEYLEQETEINRRTIRMVVSGDLDPVPFSKVEKLLIAIDRHYMLSNGEIHVVPNPRWTQERFQEWWKGRSCG